MTKLKNKAEKEGFASRWSRRKQQLRQATQASDEPEEEVASQSAEIAGNDQQQSDLEQIRAEKLARLNTLKDEDMPDIASLNDDSDFSQFMSTNVSESLRKLALHKLFHGKAYNLRDGLDEYDGDYTSFEKLDPGTITADMKHRLQLEAEKLKAQLENSLPEEVEETGEAKEDDERLEDELNETPQQATGITEEDDAESLDDVSQSGQQVSELSNSDRVNIKQEDTGQIDSESATDQPTSKSNREKKP